jgi:hypothetical protein
MREEVRWHAQDVGTRRVRVMVVNRRDFDEAGKARSLNYVEGTQGGMGREKVDRG